MPKSYRNQTFGKAGVLKNTRQVSSREATILPDTPIKAEFEVEYKKAEHA